MVIEVLALIVSGSTLGVALIGGYQLVRWLRRTINEMNRHIQALKGTVEAGCFKKS
jgi:hypothetical protein